MNESKYLQQTRFYVPDEYVNQINRCKSKQYSDLEDLVSSEMMTKVFFFCRKRDLDHRYLAAKILSLQKRHHPRKNAEGREKEKEKVLT